MKITRLHKYFALVAACLIFTGCIDDPVTPTGSISGFVYDEYGMPNSNTLVSVGEYPIIGIDRMGKFSAEPTTIPYDITIGGDGLASKYIGLTSNDIKLFSYNQYGYGNSCNMLISFPPVSKFNKVFIKFISPEFSIDFNNVVYPPDTIMATSVGIFPDKSVISGKLVYLEVEDNYNITYYKKYGVKNVTLFAAGINRFTFNENELRLPEQKLQYYHITTDNYRTAISIISFHFAGMHNSSELITEYIHNNTGIRFTPVLEGLDYRVRFTNRLTFSDTLPLRSESVKWVYAGINEDISFHHPENIRLVYPANGSAIYSDSTKFIFDDTEPGGIYMYCIFNQHYDENYLRANIITQRYPLQLSDFKTRGVNFKPGINYIWSVRKYMGYKSMEEFTSTNITEDTTYKFIPASSQNYFTYR